MIRSDIEIEGGEQPAPGEWSELLATIARLDPADLVEEAGALADALTAALDAEEGPAD